MSTVEFANGDGPARYDDIPAENIGDTMLKSMRSLQERRYFNVSACCAVFIWFWFLRQAHTIYTLAIMWTLIYALHGIYIGRLQGNAIRVGPTQFPDIHALAVAYSARLGLRSVPEVYIVEAGGSINAFATRFLFRNFVMLNSSVLEMAYDDGEDAVRFILAHEFGHVALRHMQRRAWISVGHMIPYLGAAYSRGCEESADRIGAFLAPDGAVRGICCLGTGASLMKKVNAYAYLLQMHARKDLRVHLARLHATHPHMPDRLSYLETDLILKSLEPGRSNA